MSRTARRSVLSVFAALAVVAGVAAAAWACTPQAFIDLGPSTIGPASGSPPAASGTVTVTGTGFAPGPVQIRLDSGPPLATATGPEFSISVKIPQAAAGVHYIHAVATAPDGRVAGSASRALMVKGAAPRTETAPVSPTRPATRRQPTSTEVRRPVRHRTTSEAAQPSANPAVAAPAPAASPTTAVVPARAVAPRSRKSAGTANRHRTAVHRALPVRTRPAAPVPATSNPWAVGASPASGPSTRSAGAQRPGLELTLGIGLLVLVLAGLGVAVGRRRRRPPAPEVAGPDALPKLPPSSLEAELQEFLSEHAARANSVENFERELPRERADLPR